MTKAAKVPKPPRTYICRFCQYVFKRSEHLARHERSHTQEKPFGCSVCSCMFSRKDLVVRHERMIHFERKPTTRMTSRKAQKYEPRRESQSSDAPDSLAASSSDSTSESSRRLSQQLPTIDAAAARKTAAEALSSAILQGIFDAEEALKNPGPLKIATKRRASDIEDGDNPRPTKLQILDQTLVSSPTNVAPVAPMFGRRGAAGASGSSSTAISPTTAVPTTVASAARTFSSTTTATSATAFTGYGIDPLLQDPGFDAQLEEETAEETLRMFTHSEQQLFSPPLSDGSGEAAREKKEDARGNEDYLRDTAAEAWKLQLEEEEAKVAV
ncbi:hypothetical protein DRE_07289 [Drechslerella stenobrocha 248]|uniref:C2H2-type domain-containing protein n=1 Tax=Drechslerella stenobrocha 248 TaxID=1043628 RepID=W7I517_9PEZI|nr:hypothetical protein DRE_07289 [Drechslerella stenobrocha 248]